MTPFSRAPNPASVYTNSHLNAALKPQDVTEALKLNQLKDKVWYVVPSCATTGEGIFEGLVSRHFALR